MFAFLAGKGTPRHATFDLAYPVDRDEAVRVQAALLALPGVVVARVVVTAGVIHVGYRTGATTTPILAAALSGLGIAVRAVSDELSPPTAVRDACC